MDARELEVVSTAGGGPVRLVVTDAGPLDGPAVLLLHGFPDSAAVWRHQVDHLAAAGYRVLAPDLRGYGRSDAPTDVAAYRLRLLVEDVVAVLDAAGVDRAAVVGHDWGAVLAWSFAETRPERTAALAVVSVGHPRARAAGGAGQVVKGLYVPGFLVPGLAERTLPLRGWWSLRRWAWGGADPADEPDLARQIADLSRPGRLSAGLAWYRANVALPGPFRRVHVPASTDDRPRRTPVAVPVLGVWSSRDPALVERQMTASERHVAGPWRYERLDGVDHWVPVHAPRTLSHLLLDHLREARHAPGGG